MMESKLNNASIRTYMYINPQPIFTLMSTHILGRLENGPRGPPGYKKDPYSPYKDTGPEALSLPGGAHGAKPPRHTSTQKTDYKG